MRGFLLLLCFGLVVVPICAQPGKKPAAKSTSTQVKKPSGPARPASSQAKKPTARSSDEKAELEKASAIEDLSQRIAALKKFIAAFPESTVLNQAYELLSGNAYTYGDAKFTAGEIPAAIESYKLAASSAPTPMPAGLFNDSLSKIPNTLYWTGHRPEAIEIAKTLETKVGSDPDQFAGLAMFYVGIENGDEAVRLAELAVKADPAKPKPYGVLGLANRVDFKLEESAAAYAKALELDPNSSSLRRNLAEIKRATGKADEAVALYREAVAADANDLLSQNGLVLSLFDAGKTDDAEKALAASLEQNPKNVMLMAGASYWYAAHKMDDKALDLARRAIAAEPRYVWSHIALGRALMLQNRPLEAEEALLKARAYGNFPTLEYEIASARAMAGFYRDAVEGLEKTFAVDGDSVVTKIGGRVERKAATFTEALADERRASILEPTAADDADTASRLKALLVLRAAVKEAKPDQSAVIKAADTFVAGDDNSKYHRQLYTASLLLTNKIAVDKALEFAEAAVGNADNALTIPNAGAFVMASELYESRQLALTRDEFIKVPDVPKTMLAAILRGRIEDLIGWALVQQNKPADAEIHFKRAVAILPDKSAWWRASMWRYGTALQADGKESEALGAYIRSYSIDKPDLARYTAVETLYKKLNGSTEGLEAKIGPSPLPTSEVASKSENAGLPSALPVVTATPNIDVAQPTPTPAASIEVNPATATETTNSDKHEVKSATAVEAKSPETQSPPSNVPASSLSDPPAVKQPASIDKRAVNEEKPRPEALPVATATPESSPSPSPNPEVSPTPLTSTTPEVTSPPSPTPAALESPTPQLSSTSKAETTTAKAEPDPSPTPEVVAAPTPVPETVPTPTPTPQTEPKAAATDQNPKTEKVDSVDISVPKPEPSLDVVKPIPSPSASPTPASESPVKAEPTPSPVPETVATPQSTPTNNADTVASPTSTPAEPEPKRVKTELVVSSAIPLPSPSQTPDEKSVAEVTKKEALNKPAKTTALSSSKPLFEPIVITIPKSESATPSDRRTLNLDRGNVDGRVRLVDGQPVNAIEPAPCQVNVSQEKISLLNNGGTLAVLVGVEKGDSLADLKYVVSDPDDIAVKFEPDINNIEGRSLYSISSISEKTGNFRVTFYLPCGKKDVTVAVR